MGGLTAVGSAAVDSGLEVSESGPEDSATEGSGAGTSAIELLAVLHSRVGDFMSASGARTAFAIIIARPRGVITKPITGGLC